MKVSDINEKWNRYKEYYHMENGIQIDEIRFDAEKGVECSFDITELYADRYVLHLSEDMPLYRGTYQDFVLWHEFTHFYDYLTQPFAYNVHRKIYLYMNSYSEYHAARRSLGKVLEDAFPRGGIDPEKSIIPAPYRDMSLRDLVSDTLLQAEKAHYYFTQDPRQPVFNVYFRYVMDLMGYASRFENAEDIIRFCLEDLQDESESLIALYKIMKEKDFFKILGQMDDIYKEAGITFSSAD
ncbi:MAG: hypothetical protein IJH71_01000 [Eubacterium sp.]|nr:hypothetical protein [Eubacterium sp.]